jgi:hypothetical protein
MIFMIFGSFMFSLIAHVPLAHSVALLTRSLRLLAGYFKIVQEYVSSKADERKAQYINGYHLRLFSIFRLGALEPR